MLPLLDALYVVLLPPLLAMRYRQYCDRREQLYMLDYCYGVNALCALRIVLLPEWPRLAALTFVHASGPVVSAIVLWQLWLRLDSLESITSFFVHFAPALVSARAHWSSPYSAFDSMPLYALCVASYLAWQLLNAIGLELFLRDELHTATKDLSKPPYRGLPLLILNASRAARLLRPNEVFSASEWKTKLIFMAVQLLYSCATLCVGLAFYQYFWLDVLGLVVFASLSIWKGLSNAKSLSLDMGGNAK